MAARGSPVVPPDADLCDETPGGADADGEEAGVGERLGIIEPAENDGGDAKKKVEERGAGHLRFEALGGEFGMGVHDFLGGLRRLSFGQR